MEKGGSGGGVGDVAVLCRVMWSKKVPADRNEAGVTLERAQFQAVPCDRSSLGLGGRGSHVAHLLVGLGGDKVRLLLLVVAVTGVDDSVVRVSDRHRRGLRISDCT